MVLIFYKSVGTKTHCLLSLCWALLPNTKPNTKFSKGGGGGLDRTSIFRGGDLFQGGGCNFYIKNKSKSEIFNNKNVYKQKKQDIGGIT